MTAPLDRRRLRVRPVARAGRACAAAALGWSSLISRVRARALARNVGGRPGALAEVTCLLLWILLFARLQSAAGKDITTATANALALQSMERAMHIDIEGSVNHWLAGHLVLSHLAVYLYRLYYAAIVGVLAWVFIRHAGAYRKVRRVLVAMMALILPVYWAVPESPPRFALPGVIDIVAKYDILGHASRETGNGQNHYSAMPSLHVGLSLWCAYAVWSVLRARHPRLALLSWMFPLLMAADVLTTGNHYVLDVAGSIVLLAVSIAVTSMWGRRAEHRRQARLRRSVHT